MATNIPTVMAQFFLDSGAVAANCLLDTFASGTTDEEDTWTNAAGSTLNANPIVLDAAGRCVVFVDPTLLYTFRLRAPGGATLWTRDSIAGLPVTSAEQFVPLEGDVEMTGQFSLSGNATANLQPTPLQQVNSLIATAIASVTTTLSGQYPVGAVSMWLTGAPPAKWIALDGVDRDRDDFSELFDLWGTTFGPGDGISTFGVPDTRGEFLRGYDGGRGVDSGRALGSAQTELIGAHTHDFQRIGPGSGGGEGIESDTARENQTTFTQYVKNTGTGIGAENRPRNVALMLIVRYQS